MKTLRKRNQNIIWTLALGMVLIIGMFIYVFHNQSISTDILDWASFGGYIGGTFSILSVLLMYMIFREQSLLAYRTQYESILFEKLKMLREFSEKNETILKNYSSEISSHFRVDNRDVELDNKTISELVTYYYRIHLNNMPIDQYFSYFYHIINFIDNDADIDQIDKKKYISVMQAQLSNCELFATFWNAISVNKEYIYILDYYNFYENLASDYVTIDRIKIIVCPQTRFKYKLEKPPVDYDDFGYNRVDYQNELWYDTLKRLYREVQDS